MLAKERKHEWKRDLERKCMFPYHPDVAFNIRQTPLLVVSDATSDTLKCHL